MRRTVGGTDERRAVVKLDRPQRTPPDAGLAQPSATSRPTGLTGGTDEHRASTGHAERDQSLRGLRTGRRGHFDQILTRRQAGQRQFDCVGCSGR